MVEHTPTGSVRIQSSIIILPHTEKKPEITPHTIVAVQFSGICCIKLHETIKNITPITATNIPWERGLRA
jgi:hypothetical protein